MKYQFGRIQFALICGLILVIAAGCAPSEPGIKNIDYEPFIAPSLAPTIPPTAKPKTTEIKNTPVPVIGMEVASTSGCIDNLVFISDITIPDGTVVVAGSTIDKQWEVENAGTCEWGEGYFFQLLTGLPLNTENEQALPMVAAGERVTVRMVVTAPAAAGYYRSAWQAYNPDGTAFGDPIYIDFNAE